MRTGFVRTFIWEQPQNPVVWDLILFQWQSGGLACLKTDRHENCVRWSVTGCGFSIRFDNFSPEILGWAASVWWRFEILGQRSERIAGNKLTSSVSIGQSFATVGVSTLDQAPNFLWMALSLSRLPPNIPWLITPPKWRFWGFSQRISTSLRLLWCGPADLPDFRRCSKGPFQPTMLEELLLFNTCEIYIYIDIDIDTILGII